MNEQPLISVILLTLNSEKYIGRALSSVCEQNYNNLEIIVVDAGSVDNTKKIVKSFSGIIWLDLPNSDMGMARNYGIKKSKGDFLMFLDSDDIYLKDKISEQISKIIEDDNLDFVVSTAYVMRTKDNSLGIKDWTFKKLNIDDFLMGKCYSLGALCIRKKSLNEYCVFNENDAGRYCEDWSFQFKLILNQLNFKLLEKPSILVELRNDSHTIWSVQPRMKEIGIEVVQSAFTEIKTKYLKHTIPEKQIYDIYRFKLAISYFINGMLDQGEQNLSMLSNDYRHIKIVINIISFVFPKFLTIYLFRKIWKKRQNSTFLWSKIPKKIEIWLDIHNKQLNN
jgi:glycosyltransferase involved in cell wall biosynthesis